MALVLAIEPDPRQASILKRVVRERARAEIVVVDSKDAALAAIAARLPDLILFTALLSPRDEEELVARLRELEGAEHLQLITIPLLATAGAHGGRRRGGLFGKLRRKDDAEPVGGCDPWQFADEVAGYLKTAAEEKARRLEALAIERERAEHAARSAEAALMEDTGTGEAPTAAEPVTPEITEPIVADAIADTHELPPELLAVEEAERVPVEEVAAHADAEPPAIVAAAPEPEHRAPAAAEPAAEPAPLAFATPGAEPAQPSIRIARPIKRLPPLAMWARLEPTEVRSPEPPATAHTDDLHALLDSLRVPLPVAAMSYPRRPHVRAVRTA
ncbi:MAG TPA: hypothetical protein VNI83_13330 [Vicinamibacterales bacterium]|nr:hypothetical protein [Vicinamibacterales bacterium]